MDQETIENHIKNLGKRDFDALAVLVLTRFFHMSAIDVDGKGDGGSDYLNFADENGNRTAVQRTVQDAQWEKKAFADAKKAVEQLSATRYFFLTSRAHESTTLRALESRISTQLEIPATCLGATELAGIVLQQGLLREFAEAIGLQLDISVQNRPDSGEILLHAYISLGSDRSNLKEEVYDDTLLLALHVAPREGLDRETLIKNASKLLAATSAVEERLAGRIDSLLTRGLIRKETVAAFTLSEAKRLELAVADGVYQKELESMAGAQAKVLHDLCGLEWDATRCSTAATFLARLFIQRQLVAAEHASVPLARTGLSRNVGNPEQDLRALFRSAGIPAGKVDAVLEEFVRLASGAPLVQKLARAVTYVATEGMDVLRASRVLGASNWSEVTATLDASVAIPYMCASLFCPTQGRFSRGATTCVQLLRKASSPLVIPWVYINEVSAHLLRALKYPEIDDFSESLEHSHNGFVAYYYQLKAAGQSIPENLREFVGKFAKSALRSHATQEEAVRSIMADIQPLLHQYGVDYDDISGIPEHFRKDVETSYMFRMEQLRRTKSRILVEHDVQVISHARRAISERGEIRMCLTWDAAMIAVGHELGNCGWIVSPQEASDVVQSRLRVSESQLSALAHSLARVRERPSEFGARIIDRVVQLASEQLQDWQFRERLTRFYNDALRRIDLSSESYSDVDREIDKFLELEGVPIQLTDLEAAEE